MISRRGLLAGVLASCVAPVFVPRQSLMAMPRRGVSIHLVNEVRTARSAYLQDLFTGDCQELSDLIARALYAKVNSTGFWDVFQKESGSVILAPVHEDNISRLIRGRA